MAAAADDTKDIAYYLAHPDEVDSTNTQLVNEILAAASDTAGEQVKKADEDAAKKAEEDAAAKADADAKAKADAEAKAKTEDKSTGKTEGEAEGEKAPILAKDGKHLIPHDVLTEARQGREAAEAALRDALETSNRLVARVKALEAGKTVDGDGGGKTVDELAEAIAAAKEQAPWISDVLDKLVEKSRTAEERIAELEAAEVEDDAAWEKRMQERSASALNDNATLVLWSAKAPLLLEEAAAIDQSIRTNKALAARFTTPEGEPDFAKRFEHVVKLVRAAHDGEDIPVPQAIDTKAGAGAAGKPAAAKPTDEEVKAAAKAKLAAAKDAAVTTISDIPGGSPAAQSEEEAVEKATVTELANSMMRMGPEKLQAFLSRTVR